MPIEWLLELHKWLMNNYMVTLGDKDWQQTIGIPMGFGCSPLWCNIYLVSYEVKFIQRLATLGRTDLMAKFKHAFRYIDDICWLNVQNPTEFLNPDQPRTIDNPFWIYPLHVLEIKPEVEKFAEDDPLRGISAHFMNVQVDINMNAAADFLIKKFDKRRALPFKYTQFIKFHSNRPVRNAYNVIVSQVLPILYLSNDTQSAIHEIILLIRTLVSNGFQEERLRQKVTTWLSTGHFPACTVNVSSIIHNISR